MAFYYFIPQNKTLTKSTLPLYIEGAVPISELEYQVADIIRINDPQYVIESVKKMELLINGNDLESK